MGSLQKTSQFEAVAMPAGCEDRVEGREFSGETAQLRASFDDPGRRRWDQFFGAARAPAYQQHYAYGDALAQTGLTVLRAQVFAGKRLIAAAQIEVRRLLGFISIAHVMRGPVFAPDACDDETKRACVETIAQALPLTGVHIFIVSPDGEQDDYLGAAGFKRFMTGFHTVLLDLSADEETIRSGLNGKWRNRLKAAEKADIVLTPMMKRPDKYAWLLAKEEGRRRAERYRAHDTVLVPLYQAAYGKGGIVAFEAKDGAERLGGVLFLRHGKAASYHVAWASDEGKAINVHNRLLWHAIKALKKAGVETLDLGGIDTDYNPGIARFKIGTGGDVLSLSGAWTKGPRWKRAPAPSDG